MIEVIFLSSDTKKPGAKSPRTRFNRLWRLLHFGHKAKDQKELNRLMASFSSGLYPYSKHIWSQISARIKRNADTRFSWEVVEPAEIPKTAQLQSLAWKVRVRLSSKSQQCCYDWPLDDSVDSAIIYDRESKEYLDVSITIDDEGLVLINSDRDLVGRDSLMVEGIPVIIDDRVITDDNPELTWEGNVLNLHKIESVIDTDFVDCFVSINDRRSLAEGEWNINGQEFKPIVLSRWEPSEPTSLYLGSNLVVEEWEGASRVGIGALEKIEDTTILLTSDGLPVSLEFLQDEGVWIKLINSVSGDEMNDPMDEVFNNSELKTLIDGKDFKSQVKILKKRGDLRLVLLEREPENEILSINIRTSDLHVQHKALQRLSNAPMIHHMPLMKLISSEKNPWPKFRKNENIKNWYTRVGGDGEGSDDQREFVRKAISTPDFAFLEGPPGSGKTETIGELILQILARQADAKILLCGSTQASIDNVLSRFGGYEPIQALRVVNYNRWIKGDSIDHHQMVYDRAIHHMVEPEQVQELKNLLGTHSQGMSDEDLSSIVLERSNLVAATIEGVANYRKINAALRDEFAAPKAIFDYLIIDEASKTTFTQFLVPAIFCKKWILVGDVAQLPPFANSKDISGVLDGLESSEGHNLRRACQIISQVNDDNSLKQIPRIIIESDGVISELLKEIVIEKSQEEKPKDVKWGLIGNASKTIIDDELVFINSASLSSPTPDTIGMMRLRLTGCDIVVVSKDIEEELFNLIIPTTHLHPTQVGKSRFDDEESISVKFNHPPNVFLRRSEIFKQEKLDFENRGDKKRWSPFEQRRGLIRSDNDSWGKRIAWRLQRIYELQTSENGQLRDKYFDEVKALLPRQLEKCKGCGGEGEYEKWRDSDKWEKCPVCIGSGEIPRWSKAVEEIRNFTLPSILESLQQGYSGGSAAAELSLAPRFPNTLSDGFPSEAKSNRFQSIPFQHRMHPSISQFPRQHFYKADESTDIRLKDAMRTLSKRQEITLIDSDSRRLWFDVKSDWRFGVNNDEVKRVRQALEDTIAWFNECDRTESSVAVLSPFVNQTDKLRDMMDQLIKKHGGQGMRGTRGLIGSDSRSLTFYCSTVDKFQGQEADIVILSLRTVGRIGKFDSPNRVNVALTRARECMVMVGDRKTYLQEKSRFVNEMLRSLATETPVGESQKGVWRVAR